MMRDFPVLLRAFRIRRRGLIGWSTGLALFAAMMLAVYPTVRDDSTFDDLLAEYPEGIRALFGGDVSITSGGGFLSAELLSVLPILVSIMAIGAAASLLAGDEEKGLIALILASPLRRRRVITEVAAMTVITVLIPMLVTAVVILGGGPSVRLDLAVSKTLGACVAVAVFALLHGMVTLTVAAATGRKSRATAVSAVLLVAGYLAEIVGAIAGWAEPIQAASPYHYLIASQPAVEGLAVGATIIVLLASAAFGVASVLLFERRDLVA